MKRLLVFTVVLLALPWASASAQTTDAGYADALTPSLASVARTMHATMRRNIIDAAEAVPASEYAFRPTPETRTFAQLVGHIINAEWFFVRK
ncbi:MAG: DinB family protein [Gemmatimonadaceae bacterium]